MSMVSKSPSSRPLIDPSTLRIRDQIKAGRFMSPVGFVSAGSFLAIGAACAFAAALGLSGGTRDVAPLAVMSVLWTVIGGVGVHQCQVPQRLKSSTAFIGMLAAWSTLVVAATITYLVLGTFAVVDDAIFESVAGFTTTATSVVPDPESLSHAVLAFRASTQWLGGLGALVFIVALLPSIGVGGLEVTATAGSAMRTGTSLRSRRTVTSVQRLSAVYAGLTVVGFILFLVSGMPPFDAITYAATTISTGGFANHLGSFGHFNSWTIEWAGVGGMILGGANLALLWRGVRGQLSGGVSGLTRSFELRAYIAVLVGGSAIVALTTIPEGGLTHDSIRAAAFHVASAASTTGHYTVGWAEWNVGPQVLLMAIVGVGAMSGSAGGGFRLVRALTLVGYLRREMISQLHPRAVVPVRVGRRAVSDEMVSRMIGYQSQYLLLAFTGAVLVAAFGADLVTAVTAAVSAVANMGPAMGSIAPVGGRLIDLPRPARASLVPLMFLGRLEIAPVLVGVAIASSTIRSRLPRRRGNTTTVD